MVALILKEFRTSLTVVSAILLPIIIAFLSIGIFHNIKNPWLILIVWLAIFAPSVAIICLVPISRIWERIVFAVLLILIAPTVFLGVSVVLAMMGHN